MDSTAESTAAHPYHGRVLLPKPPGHLSVPATALEHEPKTRAYVSVACDNCRKKRSRCDGRTPKCSACIKSQSSCAYALPRKNLKQRLVRDKEVLVALVKDLRLRAIDVDRARIDTVLQEVGETVADLQLFDDELSTREIALEVMDLPIQTDSDVEIALGRQQPRGSEAQAPQPLESDANEASPMDFESSTLPFWTEEEVADLEAQTALVDKPLDLNQVFDVKTLYPDDSCIEPYLPVSPRKLPPSIVAAALLKHYHERVHKWLPILSSDLETQLMAYHKDADVVPSQCLTILNLVFAIGAQYALIINDTQCLRLDGCREHHIYMSRALQSLDSRSSPTWAMKPDIVVVQILGLIATYYFAAGYMERAWCAIGCAIRFAVALQMHCPPTPGEETEAKRHVLIRTWWSLRYLDLFLSSALRRPMAVSNEICNSLPRDRLQDRQSNSWLGARLTMISQSAVQSSTAQRKLHSGLQDDDWRSVLKLELSELYEDVQMHESSLLKFSWHDAMILVTRPYKYSDTYADAGRRRKDNVPTRECINSALGLTRLLSDQPTMEFFQTSPWWSLVHHILRALSVLLPAAVGQRTQQNLSGEVVIAIDKLITWLKWLNDKDRVASTALKPILHAMERTGVWAESNIADEERNARTMISDSLRPLDEWGFSASDSLYPHFAVSADQLASLSPTFLEGLIY